MTFKPRSTFKPRTRKKSKSLSDCPYPGCCEQMSKMNYFCWDHWSALPWAWQTKLLETGRKQGRHKAVELLPTAIKLINRALEPNKPENADAVLEAGL